MTNTRWRSLMTAIGAVCVFAMAQPTVQAYPIAMLVLGCINVALIAVNVPDDAP